MERLFAIKESEKRVAELALTGEESGALFMQDAVYLLDNFNGESKIIEEAAKRGAVYYLESDAKKRALEGRMVKGVKPIDYSGMIDLMFSEVTVINV